MMMIIIIIIILNAKIRQRETFFSLDYKNTTELSMKDASHGSLWEVRQYILELWRYTSHG